jgi:hypothetical protein
MIGAKNDNRRADEKERASIWLSSIATVPPKPDLA